MFSIKTKVLPKWLLPRRRRSMRWRHHRVYVTRGKSFMTEWRRSHRKRHSDRFWDYSVPNPEG